MYQQHGERKKHHAGLRQALAVWDRLLLVELGRVGGGLQVDV